MYYPWLHVHCMPVPVRLREGEGGLCGQPPKEPKTLVKIVWLQSAGIDRGAAASSIMHLNVMPMILLWDTLVYLVHPNSLKAAHIARLACLLKQS